MAQPAGPSGTAEFARQLQEQRTPDERLDLGVAIVVDLVDGCDHAGVTVGQGEALDSAASSNDLVLWSNRWQQEFGEGPCADVVRLRRTVISNDLGHDRRWRRWAPRMVDAGVNAMMCLLLYTERESFGALNLYARGVDPWDADALVVADALAGHLAASIADAREIENRGRAMASRTMIGQAQGILMERYRVGAPTAFDVLRRISQHTNRKLTDVASEIVDTRHVPGAKDS